MAVSASNVAVKARPYNRNINQTEDTMTKQCADCRDGEHENYDDDVKLVVVKDSENRLVKRSNMCAEHVEMYLVDGYVVYYNGRTL